MLADLAKSFGRSTPAPEPIFLGAPGDAAAAETATLPPAGSDPCSLSSWWDDELDEHGKPASMSHGSMAIASALGVTALGGLIGFLIARKTGAAVGAGGGAVLGVGVAGSQYLLWRANGGSVKKPGTCGGATGLSSASANTATTKTPQDPGAPRLVSPLPGQTTPAQPATTGVLWDGTPLPKGTTVAPNGTVTYTLQGPSDYGAQPIAARFHKSAEFMQIVNINKGFPWGKAPVGAKVLIPKTWVR